MCIRDRLYAVLFKLFRNKMLLCDMELFFSCIAAKLDNVHSVEQGSGNSIKRVCGRDEKQDVYKRQGYYNTTAVQRCTAVFIYSRLLLANFRRI